MGQNQKSDARPVSTANRDIRGSKRRKISHPHPGRQTRARAPRGVQVKGTRRASQGKCLAPCPPREIRRQSGRTNHGSGLPSLQGPSNGEPKFTLSFAKFILDKIWIRNKNQHRTQPWWKSLSMLRKAVSKLVLLEQEEGFLRGQISQGGVDAKAARERFERETQVRREKEIWIDWIRQVLVAKAYLGFSGLVSDTQFAQLGVVLVGVLADVVSIVGLPTPSQQNGVGEERTGITATRRAETETGSGKARSLMATSIRVTGLQSGEIVERTYNSDDLGEVIERKGSHPEEEQQQRKGQPATRTWPDGHTDRSRTPFGSEDKPVADVAATNGVARKDRAVRVIEEWRRENPTSTTERSTAPSPSPFPSVATSRRDGATATTPQDSGAPSHPPVHSSSPSPTGPERTRNPVSKDERKHGTSTTETSAAKEERNTAKPKRTGDKGNRKGKGKGKGKNAIDDLFAGLT